MAFVIRMVTGKGVFFWDGAGMYARGKGPENVYRMWGWYSSVEQAQQYRVVAAAHRTATVLYSDLSRLYPVRIDVVRVNGTAETEVTNVGDCLKSE